MSRKKPAVIEKKVLLLFFLLSIVSNVFFQSGFAAEEKPLLLLHFDINKTLIATDAAGGKSKEDVIIHCLADTCKERWDLEVKIPMSYSDYVKEYLLPGSSQDQALKQQRDQKISQFLLFLKKEKPDLYETVFSEYKKASAALLAQKTLVFSSFYALIDFLKKNGYEFSIILRSFGKEIEQVSSEIEKLANITFTKRGSFQGGLLHVEGDGIFAHVKDLYSFFKSNKHLCIQDSYARWFESGKKQEFGKPFPLDRNDNSTLSLFFDDNVSAESSSGKNIVNPIDVETNQSIPIDVLFQSHELVSVDTIQAIQDRSYFIQQVQEALQEKKRHSDLSHASKEPVTAEAVFAE